MSQLIVPTIAQLENDWSKFSHTGTPSTPYRVSFNRMQAPTNQMTLTTSRLHLAGFYMKAGEVITGITMLKNSVQMTSGTVQQFVICTSSDGGANVTVAAITSNDGSTAWNANAFKRLVVSSPYTVPTTGIYHIGLNILATTPGGLVSTLTGVVGQNIAAPAVCFFSTANTGGALAVSATSANTGTTMVPWVSID